MNEHDKRRGHFERLLDDVEQLTRRPVESLTLQQLEAALLEVGATPGEVRAFFAHAPDYRAHLIEMNCKVRIY